MHNHRAKNDSALATISGIIADEKGHRAAPMRKDEPSITSIRRAPLRPSKQSVAATADIHSETRKNRRLKEIVATEGGQPA